MTSKEAVDILWRYDVNFEPHPAEEVMHAIDIAIEALNAQPETHDKRTETHSCDLISRQDAIDAIDEMFSHEVNDEIDVVWNQAIEGASNKIKYDLPSAQPEIIRCKDCKYSEYWYKDKRRCFLWHEEGIDVFDDGYCNYAKRRMRGEQDD